jgi:hypothetical protein
MCVLRASGASERTVKTFAAWRKGIYTVRRMYYLGRDAGRSSRFILKPRHPGEHQPLRFTGIGGKSSRAQL